MKKFVISTPKKEEYDTLMSWAEVNGLKWSSGSATKGNKWIVYRDETCVHINNPNSLEFAPQNHFTQKGYIVVPFNAFAAIKGIELGPPNETHTLNEEYSAVFDFQNQTMTVGCQIIPFTKVREMAAITKKYAPKQEENITIPPLRRINDSECHAALRNALRIGFGSQASDYNMKSVASYLQNNNFVIAELKK